MAIPELHIGHLYNANNEDIDRQPVHWTHDVRIWLALAIAALVTVVLVALYLQES